MICPQINRDFRQVPGHSCVAIALIGSVRLITAVLTADDRYMPTHAASLTADASSASKPAAGHPGIQSLRVTRKDVLADGPDEVHKNALARNELKRQRARRTA